jgi:predicted HicB family RNase H-like nuclease
LTTRKQAGLRIPADLNEIFVNAADRMGITKNALMAQVLWEWAKSQPEPDGERKQSA